MGLFDFQEDGNADCDNNRIGKSLYLLFVFFPFFTKDTKFGEESIERLYLRHS